MTWFWIALGVLLIAAVVVRRHKRLKRTYPQYDWMGRPLPHSCSVGRHNTPDIIVGMTWDEVACMRCQFQCFARPRPIPSTETMTGSVAVAYYGEIYDKTQVSIQWDWPHITRYRLLSLTDLLVGLQVEVTDARKGETEYLLNIGAGSTEIDGHNIDPLTLDITRGQMASLILGQEKEIVCPQGKVEIREPMFFRFGWGLDDVRRLVIYGPGDKYVASLSLGHELLGKVLRPWAIAATENGHVQWPGRNGEKLVFTVLEGGMDHSYLNVWSRQIDNQVEITQLRLNEVDTGVIWRTTDDEVVVTVGKIRRVDMHGCYSRDKDAIYKSIANDGDDPMPETIWLDSTECRFPVEQLAAIRQNGWGQLTLTGDDCEILKLYEKVQSPGEGWSGGFRFAFGTISHPDIEGVIPVGWTCATYGMMQKWAQRARATAAY